MKQRHRFASPAFGSAFLFAVMAVTSFSLPGPLPVEEKLAAPVYPEAVRLSPAQVKNMEGVMFAVKDDHAKVLAFYAPKYARVPKDDDMVDRGPNELALIIQDEPAILKMILAKKGDMTLSRPSLLRLEWLSDQLSGSNPVSRFWMELERQSKRFKGHEAELAELKAAYAYLNSSFYFEKKYQEILTRCGNESGNGEMRMADPKISKEYAAEIKKLQEEGRYQEMAALNEKYFGNQAEAEKRRKADNFGVWKKGLADLAAVSYRTKVTIDVDPNQWDVRWKN
jgi:hypothetical protein